MFELDYNHPTTRIAKRVPIGATNVPEPPFEVELDGADFGAEEAAGEATGEVTGEAAELVVSVGDTTALEIVVRLDKETEESVAAPEPELEVGF